MFARFVTSLFAFILVLVSAPGVMGQENSPSNERLPDAEGPTSVQVVRQMVDQAKALLAALDKSQQEKLSFSFTDNKQRENWSNLPVGIVPRAGLRMGDLSQVQRESVFALLKVTLSERGFQQVIDNMNGDQFLKDSGRGRSDFGSDEYYISILGKPSVTEPWMWQFGGHHLAINATVVGSNVTLSPSLTGGQPVDYEWKSKPIRQLAEEEDTAYQLVASFSDKQRQLAVVEQRISDLRFGPGVSSLEPRQEGLPFRDMTDEQKALITELIQHRIGVLNPTHAKLAMNKISDALPETFFSWHGSTTEGKAASFRIQSPALLIEYCPQQMGGTATDHLHAMYRDPSNDYGLGWIRASDKD